MAFYRGGGPNEMIASGPNQSIEITRAIRDRSLSHKNRLQYLAHAERLDKELKAVTKARC
jgi:hypothetical protein